MFWQNGPHSVVEEPHLVFGFCFLTTTSFWFLHQVVVNGINVFAKLVKRLEKRTFVLSWPIHSLGPRLAFNDWRYFHLLLFLMVLIWNSKQINVNYLYLGNTKWPWNIYTFACKAYTKQGKEFILHVLFIWLKKEKHIYPSVNYNQQFTASICLFGFVCDWIAS